MSKMALSGQHHGNSEFIAGVNDVLVLNRSPGLDNGLDFIIFGDRDGVRHREKRIACQGSAVGPVRGLAACKQERVVLPSLSRSR